MLKKRNQKGFTLIEIIAVLVILGILAAVAIPRYLDLQDEARNKAALGAIAEAKGRLSSGYAKALMIKNGAAVSVAEAMGNANIAAGSWGDYTVAVDESTTYATITVSAVQGTTITDKLGYWNLPQ
ncbi:MAG: prepilin-type cleavage/methylation domain-containing protein [Deltaproteobacteria bacterium HGW-Deltaproteobacteria-19]|nr:MAG: prepilin-type cleavage/methylation domain-containing protein [Deltaproteobacteria bacterium HGW-Deltaproteobacteria-19]